MIVQQHGADITTSILRVDGDTGALTGGWQGDKFVASHFDGARPGLLEITPQTDGTLKVVSGGSNRDGVMTAYRPEVARAMGLPEPANYQTHTSVRDPNEVFTYSFPDTHGKIIFGMQIRRFKNHVVLGDRHGNVVPESATTKRSIWSSFTPNIMIKDWRLSLWTLKSPEQQSSLKTRKCIY